MEICCRENLRERGLRDVRLDVRIDDAANERAFAEKCLERRREIMQVAKEKGATPNPDTLLSELSDAARTLGFVLDMREKDSPPVDGAVTLKGPERPRRKRSPRKRRK